MKKIFIFLTIGAVTFACDSASDKKDETAAGTTDTATAAQPPATAETQYQKGLELVAGSDCTTCHKINEKNIGPAYAEVAKKYEPTEANINDLATKIIKGSTGVWGTVPMTPHPTISEEDAREMIKYILSLKNQ